MKKTLKDYIQEAADKYVLGTYGAGWRCKKAYEDGIKKGMEFMRNLPEDITKIQIV